MSSPAMSSPYGRVDDAVEQSRLEARRKTRKRIAIISISSVVLAVIVVAAVVGTAHRSSDSGERRGDSISSSVKAVCDLTRYPDTCYATLPPAVNTSHVTPEYLLRLSIEIALNELSKASTRLGSLHPGANNNFSAAALANCRELVDTAVEDLTTSASASTGSITNVADDLRTWLSSVGTCIYTCIDGFDESDKLRTTVESHLKNSTEVSSNSLAIVTWISKLTGSIKLRRLMEVAETPDWVDYRRVVLESADSLRRKADIVVSKNGEGKYKTIKQALKAVKKKNKKRTVIYVKSGVYKENVRVEKTMWNVYMVGDGMDKTVVTGSLNVIDGTPTFSTATFAVFGQGFVGREMGFRNTAGPTKHQAVALMASADQVAFHKCKVEAYQDSLYVHSKRQFLRDCDIYGTVDFIFGNAAAVLQNCRILPRLPLPGQQNTITAQGRTDPNMNTGLSIQNCSVSPAANLSGVKTYLGRPWKDFSTTIYARSYLGGLIHPSGWLPWVGDSAPDTIYYGEFQNYGPGSDTRFRVNWKGLRKSLSRKEAVKFSVEPFLQGGGWIGAAGIPFNPSV